MFTTSWLTYILFTGQCRSLMYPQSRVHILEKHPTSQSLPSTNIQEIHQASRLSSLLGIDIPNWDAVVPSPSAIDENDIRPTSTRQAGSGPAIPFIVIQLLYIVLFTDPQGVEEQTRDDERRQDETREERRATIDREQATTNRGTICPHHRYTEQRRQTD